jgi:hypothetical protein
MGQGSSTRHRGSFLPAGGHDGGEEHDGGDDGGMEMGPQERPYGPTRRGPKRRILKTMLTVGTNNPVSVRGGFGPGLKANNNFAELMNERALHHDMCALIENGTSLTHRGNVANKKGDTSSAGDRSKNLKNRLKVGKTAAAAGESAVDETLVRVLQKKIVNSESEYEQHGQTMHDLSIRTPLMEDLLTEFGYYRGLAEAELAGQGRAFRYEAAASIIINSYQRRPIDAHRLDRQSLREITWLQGVGFHTIAGWCVFLHCLLFILEWPQLGDDELCRDMGETHCAVILGLAGNASSFDVSKSECYPKFEMGNTAAMIIELLFGVVHVLEAFFQLRHRTGRLWGGQRVNFVWIKVRKQEGNDAVPQPPFHLSLPVV